MQISPGGIPPSGKDLVEIHLADLRPPGQGGLGDPLPGVERRQQRREIPLVEGTAVVVNVGVQVRLGHQLLAEIAGGLLLHAGPPFTFCAAFCILILYKISPADAICRPHSVCVIEE